MNYPKILTISPFTFYEILMVKWLNFNGRSQLAPIEIVLLFIFPAQKYIPQFCFQYLSSGFQQTLCFPNFFFGTLCLLLRAIFPRIYLSFFIFQKQRKTFFCFLKKFYTLFIYFFPFQGYSFYSYFLPNCWQLEILVVSVSTRPKIQFFSYKRCFGPRRYQMVYYLFQNAEYSF